MKGCEVRVERLILADTEPEFEDMQVGVPTCLHYIPVAMLLRALDVDWTLPTVCLPSLPRGCDRRGLFLLRPSSDYFTMTTLAR
eukprot:625691-Karenia_brevis.AAC.1